MKCQHCGATVVEGAAFCHECGKSLDARAKPAAGNTASADHAAAPTPGKQAFTKAVTRRGADDDPDTPLWEGSFSKLAMIGSWLTAAGLTIAVLVVGFAAGFERRGWLWSLGLVAAVWIFLLLRLLYMQLSVRYWLTSQRFVHERGLLWRQQDRIETIDIDDVTVSQGPVQRMLGIGSVQIRSSDQSTPQFMLVGIEDVRNVAAMIDDVRRKERRKRGVHIEQV